ncbi:MAG: hypothetical protein LBL36_07680, partial [Clostridiales Family XIII bacterium]|nr:hypothetical protein [Clostridiales Family XIII bacterium]
YLAYAGERHINLNYPIGGMFADFEVFSAAPNRPTKFFSIDPEGTSKRPAGMYLTAYERGYYGEIAATPQKIKDYADQQGFMLKGPLYHIFLHDEMSEIDPDNYLSEISIAVTSKLQKA